MNALIMDRYKVYDDQYPAPKNKPSAICDTEWKIYRYGCNWNGIDHRRV